MAKRRGNHEGSIYQRPDGRWCAQVTLNGRRLTHYAKTQRDCREWIKITTVQIDQGLTVKGAQATVEEFFVNWLDIAKPTLSPRTQELYSQLLRNRITPALGNLKLKDLRPDHIQSLYAEMLESGSSARSVGMVHALLRRALGQGLKWGLLTRNPCDAVEKPKSTRPEMKGLDVKQVKCLLRAAEGDRFEALYHLAVTTGLRRGELFGLRWSDLDWHNGHLQIRRQLQRLEGEGLTFSQTKSATGQRSVVLGSVVLEQLRQHQIRQEDERRMAGERWVDHDLISDKTGNAI